MSADKLAFRQAAKSETWHIVDKHDHPLCGTKAGLLPSSPQTSLLTGDWDYVCQNCTFSTKLHLEDGGSRLERWYPRMKRVCEECDKEIEGWSHQHSKLT